MRRQPAGAFGNRWLPYILVPPPTGVAASDNAAIQSAMSACPAGGVVQLQAGTYVITGLTITKTLTLRGTGGANLSVTPWTTFGTLITIDSATAVAIQVSSKGVNLENFALQNTHGTAPTAGAGIQTVTGGGDSTHYGPNLSVRGFYHCIDHQAGGAWYMDPSCFLCDWSYSGLKIQNVDNADFGDMVVSGLFYAGPTNTPNSSGAAILWLSGGGFRGYAIKINNFGSIVLNVGIQLLLQDGLSTGDFLIADSSIENCDWGILLQHAGPSNTGVFVNTIIQGCEFETLGGGGTAVIGIGPAVTGKVKDINILGNVLRGGSSQVGIEFANLDNASHGPNVFRTVGTVFQDAGGNTNLTSVGNG